MPNWVITPGIVSDRRGLFCRGGCELVFQPVDATYPGLQNAVRQRDAHESVIHSYVHLPLPPEPIRVGLKSLFGTRGFRHR